MTRPLILLLIVFVSSQALNAQDFVQWRYDLEQAKKIASDEDKLVLMHFTATWCAPCKELERFVFANPIAIRKISDQVVPLKIDVDIHTQIASEYEIRSVPTDIIMTPAGHVILKRESPRSTDRFIEMIELAVQRSGSLTNEMIENSAVLKNMLAKKKQDSTEKQSGEFQFVSAQQDRSNVIRPQSGGQFNPTNFKPKFPNSTPWSSPKTPAVGPVNSPATPADQIEIPTTEDLQKTTLSKPGLPFGGITKNKNDFLPPAKNAIETPKQPNTVVAKERAAQDAVGSESALVQFNSYVGRSKRSSRISTSAKKPVIGLDGYCAVTLIRDQKWVKGDKQWGCFHRGKLYLFTSQKKRNEFQATPDMFSPLLGGSDPVEYHDNGKLIDGKRSFGVFYGDDEGPQLIVLFKDQANRNKFESQPGRYLKTVRQAMSTLDKDTLLR